MIIGKSSNPMQNMQSVLFDNVIVNNPGFSPWGTEYYACSGVEGTAEGDTKPPPPCFQRKLY